MQSNDGLHDISELKTQFVRNFLWPYHIPEYRIHFGIIPKGIYFGEKFGFIASNSGEKFHIRTKHRIFPKIEFEAEKMLRIIRGKPNSQDPLFITKGERVLYTPPLDEKNHSDNWILVKDLENVLNQLSSLVTYKVSLEIWRDGRARRIKYLGIFEEHRFKTFVGYTDFQEGMRYMHYIFEKRISTGQWEKCEDPRGFSHQLPFSKTALVNRIE